jgi:hypothetical protein
MDVNTAVVILLGMYGIYLGFCRWLDFRASCDCRKP